MPDEIQDVQEDPPETFDGDPEDEAPEAAAELASEEASTPTAPTPVPAPAEALSEDDRALLAMVRAHGPALRGLIEERLKPAPKAAEADPWGNDFAGWAAKAFENGDEFKAKILGPRAKLEAEVAELKALIAGLQGNVGAHFWRAQNPHLSAHEAEVTALLQRGTPIEVATDYVARKQGVGPYGKTTAKSAEQVAALDARRKAADGPRGAREPDVKVRVATGKKLPRGQRPSFDDSIAYAKAEKSRGRIGA